MDSKQRRKQEHKCVRCGTPTALKADGSHYTICDACREVVAKRRQAEYTKCKTKHVCVDCGAPTEQKEDGTYYARCAACMKWRKRYWHDWRNRRKN